MKKMSEQKIGYLLANIIKTQKKLAKIQHREVVFVHDTETYADRENVDCVPYRVEY